MVNLAKDRKTDSCSFFLFNKNVTVKKYEHITWFVFPSTLQHDLFSQLLYNDFFFHLLYTIISFSNSCTTWCVFSNCSITWFIFPIAPVFFQMICFPNNRQQTGRNSMPRLSIVVSKTWKDVYQWRSFHLGTLMGHGVLHYSDRPEKFRVNNFTL